MIWDGRRKGFRVVKGVEKKTRWPREITSMLKRRHVPKTKKMELEGQVIWFIKVATHVFIQRAIQAAII